MASITDQIASADEAIQRNIDSLADQRALLSQNILSQLRNLVEGVIVRLHVGRGDAEFDYADVGPALAFARSNARLNFLGTFHKLIQKVASHYTLDGDTSERLMLKYYEYLIRIRSLLKDVCEMEVLTNLARFPVDVDPSLREYHVQIAAKIAQARARPTEQPVQGRYYIHKVRPFFVDAGIFYEITFYDATNKVSKFDRQIAFTDIDVSDKYAATLTLTSDSIVVFGQSMPITIIRNWKVSIRPCELNNFARLLGIRTRVRTNSTEYDYLMRRLTETSGSLLDLIEMPDQRYAEVRSRGIGGGAKPQIFPVLDRARQIIRSGMPGHNVLRYLLLRMHNSVLKPQYSWDGCRRLSGLSLKYGCIPFDEMPLCTSLPEHNPRLWDLMETIDAGDRGHELLARRVTQNVERHGILYTPVSDLTAFGNVGDLVSTYNSKLYYKHGQRRLVLDKQHIFLAGYEDDTVTIVTTLQDYASSGIAGYVPAVERWLDEAPHGIDDDLKREALTRLFDRSRVALIYGAAGTGKSTMLDYIASYFNDKKKLFLAHTHPAVDNLKRRVTAQNSVFRTVRSHIYASASPDYDLLVIDECSTVSNADLVKVLKKTRFRLIVLVGDIFQIASIQFGNWFDIIRSFIPSSSVFELTTPYRTKSVGLLEFWDKVRNLDGDVAEVMARNGYSTVLDESLFVSRSQDEIILALNYDGLYGINNINRFLQSSNPAPPIRWRTATYKVGDPVLFNETDRFRPVVYNNLKGWIVDIAQIPGQIWFDIELDRPLTEFDVGDGELEWVGGSTIRFAVHDQNTSDEDDDSLDSTIPFQVAYAVSIHKAQGLEYDSVKVVITDANEEHITHSIFYTAITRARERLQVYWTPETQHGVLTSLNRSTSTKDVALLASRRGLIPLS